MRLRTQAVPGAVWAVAAAVFAALVTTAPRYGYHRDELYFLAAGHHLAWGYPDQPPLAPAVARLMSAAAPGSLTVLRLPSALSATAVVVLAALIARELGARRGGQVVAAAVTALSGVVLATGHLLSTATFGLLAATALTWLIVRILRTGDQRWWLPAGVVAGIGLLDNDLLLLVAGGVAVGVLLVGPRAVLRSPWLWVGVVVAGALWAPYLAWQADHGWPQLTVAHQIAAGSSGTSQPRWLVVPFQLLLVNPVLTPVWIAGLVGLLRAPRLRPFRAVGVGYLVALAAVVAAGGKGYYVDGYYAALTAAGAQPTVDWVARGRRRARRAAAITLGVLAAGVIVVTLPVVPVSELHRTPVVAVNYDAGETVGWPAYVDEIAAAYRDATFESAEPGVILTANYGEAGAVDRFGERYGLPPAYSGHNGYWYWGPPPGDARAETVLMVGFPDAVAARWCGVVVSVQRLDNHVGVGDDEQGASVVACRGLVSSWRSVWPQLKTLG